jgi:hypothetical protein
MNKDIQPAINPLNLENIMKLLKAYEASREDTNGPGPDSYLPGWWGGMGMRRRTMAVLTGLLVTLTLAGCASAPQRVLSEKEPIYAALPNGNNPMYPDQLSSLHVRGTSGSEGNLVRNLELKRGHALNILSMSGGGQNGAFGAGLAISHAPQWLNSKKGGTVYCPPITLLI